MLKYKPIPLAPTPTRYRGLFCDESHWTQQDSLQTDCRTQGAGVFQREGDSWCDEDEEHDAGGSDDDTLTLGSCGVTPAYETHFDDVHRSERKVMEAHRCQRWKDTHLFPPMATKAAERVRFSLAFSGGGVRAAAFQAGVLWRLAEEDRLQDVDYLCAVSGGAYIASAFASQVSAAYKEGGPSSHISVRDWYLRVIAATIDRCQSNAGNFIRDPQGDACGCPDDGFGVLPRAFDIPLLLVALSYTLCISPMLYIFLGLVPLLEVLEAFWGTSMRGKFCATVLNIGLPGSVGYRDWLEEISGLDLYILEYTSIYPWASAFCTFLAWIAMRGFSLYQVNIPGGRRLRPKFVTAFLIARSFRALLLRLTICLIVGVGCMDLVYSWQLHRYDGIRDIELIGPLCCEYLARERTSTCFIMQSTQVMNEYVSARALGVCERYDGSQHGEVARTTFAGGNVSSVALEKLRAQAHPQEWPQARARRLLSCSSIVVVVFLCCLALARPGCFVWIASYAGPLIGLFAVFVSVQWRIYAPITDQKLFGIFEYMASKWNMLVTLCLGATCLGVPLSIRLRSMWHSFYRRTLRRNYHAGRECSLQEVQANPWCPLLLFTGTVNDYKPFTRPGDDIAISEISFTALHTGSERTGYVETSKHRSLSRVTALSGAGCLDAVSLSMSDKGRYRFWLECLNLSWGSFIFFQEENEKSVVRTVERCLLKNGRERPGRLARVALQQLRSLRSDLLMMFACVLLNVGFMLLRDHDQKMCMAGKWLVLDALAIFGVMTACSFFLFFGIFDWLSYSTTLRQFHQATNYYYLGDRPPSLLYVTDGGVQDCTTILQLLRRRSKLMLLVLAAADAEDELGVFRDMMRLAAEERLASFYDPQDSSRSVSILLEEFSQNKERTFFELGVRFDGESGHLPRESKAEPLVEHARLVVVKFRQPPSMKGRACPGLLGQDEILGFAAPEQDSSEELCPEDLGGLGCCDCCHRNGCNCGRKFPHLMFTGYLWLTPLLYSSLCRLGHGLSADGVKALSIGPRLRRA